LGREMGEHAQMAKEKCNLVVYHMVTYWKSTIANNSSVLSCTTIL